MSHDPFDFDDEDDRTVLRPSGNPANFAASTPQTARATAALPPLGGINPLEKAASKLLPLVITIKHSSSHPNPEQLRNRLIHELNEFKKTALGILQDPKKVTQASYVMCTVLDEAAMNTPWGHQSNWSQNNLLATFHNEVIGGERFFTLLKGLGKHPKENIELLELMYVCLSLGYEGTYRIAPNGQNTLAKVRNWLFEIITSVRSRAEPALSLQWQGTQVKESKLPKFTVFWVVAAIALTLASVLFVSYRFSLGQRTDEAIASFYTIKAEPLAVRSITPPAAPTAKDNTGTASLTELLQAQIDLGLVEVIDTFNEGKIRLLGNNIFASGRAELNTNLVPLLSAIANALNRFEGTILITGHSDNIPMRSGRYASNLVLSQARAESVASQLTQLINPPDRVNAEGRGSLEPIADNSTASGRALNRRVDISIFY